MNHPGQRQVTQASLIHKGQCLSVCVFSIEIQTAGRPMSGYPNMLELSIISYISILFLIPILNHPGQRRVTQASVKYLIKISHKTWPDDSIGVSYYKPRVDSIFRLPPCFTVGS